MELPDWIAAGKRVGVLERGFNTSKFLGFGRVDRLTPAQIVVSRDGAQERYQRVSLKGIGVANRMELVDPTGSTAARPIIGELMGALGGRYNLLRGDAATVLSEVVQIRDAADKAISELTALLDAAEILDGPVTHPK